MEHSNAPNPAFCCAPERATNTSAARDLGERGEAGVRIDPRCPFHLDDLENWTYQGKILDQPGHRNSDGTIGKHADVVVSGDRAYIIYFTHPNTEDAPPRKGVSPLSNRHTALQAAELEVRDGRLVGDRDKKFRLRLTKPPAP